MSVTSKRRVDLGQCLRLKHPREIGLFGLDQPDVYGDLNTAPLCTDTFAFYPIHEGSVGTLGGLNRTDLAGSFDGVTDHLQ